MHPAIEHMNLCFELEKMLYQIKMTNPFSQEFKDLTAEYNRKNQRRLELEDENPQYK